METSPLLSPAVFVPVPDPKRKKGEADTPRRTAKVASAVGLYLLYRLLDSIFDRLFPDWPWIRDVWDLVVSGSAPWLSATLAWIVGHFDLLLGLFACALALRMYRSIRAHESAWKAALDEANTNTRVAYGEREKSFSPFRARIAELEDAREQRLAECGRAIGERVQMALRIAVRGKKDLTPVDYATWLSDSAGPVNAFLKLDAQRRWMQIIERQASGFGDRHDEAIRSRAREMTSFRDEMKPGDVTLPERAR